VAEDSAVARMIRCWPRKNEDQAVLDNRQAPRLPDLFGKY